MAEIKPKELQVLLDKDAIKELIYEWDYLFDGREEDRSTVIDQLCTQDIIFDGGPLGRTEGRNAFKEVAEDVFEEELLFTRHMRHNPIIEVDGDDATGKWYAEIPSITGDGKAVWIQGTYEIDFRRVDGRWKISKYAFEFTYATPHDKGWVKQPFIEDVPGELEW